MKTLLIIYAGSGMLLVSENNELIEGLPLLVVCI